MIRPLLVAMLILMASSSALAQSRADVTFTYVDQNGSTVECTIEAPPSILEQLTALLDSVAEAVLRRLGPRENRENSDAGSIPDLTLIALELCLQLIMDERDEDQADTGAPDRSRLETVIVR